MKKICIALLTIVMAMNACAMAGTVDAVPSAIVTSGDYDYSVDGNAAVIVRYNGSGVNVRIPSKIDGYPVVAVGDAAFRYRKLKRVSLPDGIQRIGKQAFEYCEITDALRLPENAAIAENAFAYATLPSAVVIPAGAVVEKDAFSYCKAMDRVVIESGSVIKSRAIEYCADVLLAVCAEGSHLEKDAFGLCRRMNRAILCGDVEAGEESFSNHENMELTAAGAGEYEALKRSALDGSLKGRADPYEDAPAEWELAILNSPAAMAGVTVTLEKATAVKNPKTGGFTYTFTGTLANDSDEGIMQVNYTFALIDINGEEFRSFTERYDGEDAAMPPHTRMDFTHDGIKWGKQSIPAAVRIGISSVKTETELPPAHVPGKGEFLYQTLGDEKLANIRKEKPVELSFHVDQGGYGRTATFRAGSELDRAVELFCAIRIGEESDEWVTDNYNWIGFEWEDGSFSGVSLNLYSLEYSVHSNLHTYRLEDLNAFWSYCAGYLQEDG